MFRQAIAIPKPMKLVTAPSGRRLLLIWRTEFLFYTPERRQLATEWNHVRLAAPQLGKLRGVINHPLDCPLPFSDGSFDAIYCFHTIEHLNLGRNRRFFQDLHRLLKPGGICRVSTPDLEFHAREYLDCLREQAAQGSADNYARYQWATCNLIDQCSREVSGGEMLGLIQRKEIVPEYVKHMNGDLLYFLFPPGPPESAVAPSFPRRVLSKAARFPIRVLRAIYRRVTPFISRKSFLELSYERNLWLFDSVSLDRLFSDAHFDNITIKDHKSSAIADWDRYNFDESAFGSYPLEPSLYVEGTK